MKADLHVHTTFSPDAHDSMEAMTRAAIERGLSFLCFTDHYDPYPADKGGGVFDFEAYSDSVERCREQFAGQITIAKGVEFGEPHVFLREYERVRRLSFDMVMVSLHQIDFRFIGDPAYIARFGSVEAYFAFYYENVAALAEVGGYNVLAHLDFPRRYHDGPPPSDAVLARIFAALRKHDAVLEINTSGLRGAGRRTLPDADILRRYREFGLRRVTLGSDSHRTQDVGAGLEQAAALVEEIGLEQVVFAEKQAVRVRAAAQTACAASEDSGARRAANHKE